MHRILGMDYLQTLEFQMAALQRKLRLLQDLRFFVETSSPGELAGFGDELRAVVTASGASLGSVLASLLGAREGRLASPPVAAEEPTVWPTTGVAAPGSGTAASRRPSGAAPSGEAPAEAAPPSQEKGALGVDRGQASFSLPVEAPGSAIEAGGLGEGPSELLGLIEAGMKSIPAASFLMGSETDDAEKPPHRVTLGAFRLCDHLVTNKEYSMFIEANPQWAKDRADPELRDENYLSDWGEGGYPEGRDDNPVAYVSYHAALAFASWLGKRLPTEAEWECAARGGLVGKKFPSGDLMNDKIANLAKQYRGTTAVRRFEPNGFGLYDMAGNLFEWTGDWYGPYAPGDARDPKGPATGEYKVVRGGSWMSGAGALRVSARVDMEPQLCGQVGIRLADDI